MEIHNLNVSRINSSSDCNGNLSCNICSFTMNNKRIDCEPYKLLDYRLMLMETALDSLGNGSTVLKICLVNV